MARLSRLAVAGYPHLVFQQSVHGQAAFADDEDREVFLRLLAELCRDGAVNIHAYALLEGSLYLLLTPKSDKDLSRFMQALGRRYIAIFNRRHGRTGALWAGRFRAAVVDPQECLLDSVLFVDSRVPVEADGRPWTSAGHHLGRGRSPCLTDHPAFWRLGNTPFEREARYRQIFDEGLSAARAAQIQSAARLGWAIGGPPFIAELQKFVARPLAPRPRGRPKKGVLASI